MAHGPAGWLATGGPVAGTAQQPVVVTSADGTGWRAAPGTFAGTDLTAAGAAAGQSGYVIVGAQVTGASTFPVAWWSSDLGTWSRVGRPVPGASAPGAPGLGGRGADAGRRGPAVRIRRGGPARDAPGRVDVR